MLRDRLVVGITDSSLSERMQLDPDLTLEKAKKLVQQREAVNVEGSVFPVCTCCQLLVADL